MISLILILQMLYELKIDEDALNFYEDFLKFKLKDVDSWLGKTNCLDKLKRFHFFLQY